MKNITRSLVGFSLAALLGGPAIAQDCVDFQGISHCPIGMASLVDGNRGLNVYGLGADGDDGFASRFAPTTLWKARMETPNQGFESSVLSAISGGEATSRLSLEPADDGYRIRAFFTGAVDENSYSVLVYKDGILQGSLGNLSGSEDSRRVTTKPTKEMTTEQPEKLISGEAIFLAWKGDYLWELLFGFSVSAEGSCNWSIGLSEAVEIALPNGDRVEGDEVRFVEDVRGPGHYPYLGFNAIETRTSASRLVVTDEFAEQSR